jgi:plastocyanin
VAACATLLTAPAAAAPPSLDVGIQFDAFGPQQLDVLPGETVTWDNVGGRTHTVTSDTGLFDSGALEAGTRFQQAFGDVGSYTYHCTLHPTMTGEIDVRRVTLGVLPTAAVPAGAPVAADGRTANPSRPVAVQHSTDAGRTWTTVANATPAADGTWATTFVAVQSGSVRAIAGADADASETRPLVVTSRSVTVRATKTGVRVTVTPALPYAHVVLQADLQERFGWWTIADTRLDYVSQATFRVARSARVRVRLVAQDGWTPLATSRVVVLGHAMPTHTGHHGHAMPTHTGHHGGAMS